MLRLFFQCLIVFSLVFVSWAVAETSPLPGEEFKLANHCPPSFEKMPDGGCDVRSLYQLYQSPARYGGLRAPLPPAQDGYTSQQIDLGRYLFFDPLLAGDGQTSCAHCHHPQHGFSDGKAMAVGFNGSGWGPSRHGGTQLNRATPSLWNLAFQDSFFWDGRANTLETQVEVPLFDKSEMGNTPQRLQESLNANDIYRRLFREAFSLDDDAPVTVALVVRALAAFQGSLISLNSRYDRYAHGDHSALSEEEIEGHNLFRSFVTRCSQCHTPPLFSNNQIAVIGAPEPEGKPFDLGAFSVTGAEEWRGGFKVPSLRNIATTAPYMHSGIFSSLEQVVDFYNDERGHAVPKDQDLKIHWHVAMQYKSLSKQEERALIAFLNTLTDESMMPVVPSSVPSGLPVVSIDAAIGNSVRQPILEE